MMRSTSPAMSEISVGSPSPPPSYSYHAAPLNMKRLRSNDDTQQNHLFPAPLVPLAVRRKSTAERVKSFSIADILGKKEEDGKSDSKSNAVSAPSASMQSSIASTLTAIPTTQLLPAQLLAERLHPAVLGHGHAALSPLFMLDLPSLHKVIPAGGWDSATAAAASAAAHPSQHNPFFPPALIHYEQRLAWDYHRQLQEHFQAQAQLLRKMSMDPNIIPSEDGSERSRSSSAGSQCCSPDVNVAEDDDDDDDDDVDDNDDANHDKDNFSSADRLSGVANGKCNNKKSANDTPLDALFQLSTKNFDEDQDPATLNIFATRPNPKKKRKSRTAFTNHQIFELEKRFLYQKYLSPADRDEIAAGLGLSNAQVITWFQNRRAKLKRDMEELKKDVESVKQLSAHKSFLENVNDLSILKTRPVSRHQHNPQPAAEGSFTAATSAVHGNPTGGVQPPYRGEGRLPAHIIQPQQPPHVGNIDASTTTTSTTTDTCNDSRETSGQRDNSISNRSQQVTMHQQHPQQQQQQQPPRNIQINSSRG